MIMFKHICRFVKFGPRNVPIPGVIVLGVGIQFSEIFHVL